VWVVKDAHFGTILGAFTVKHELKKWLASTPPIYPKEALLIFRCRDGKPEVASPIFYRNEL
jgi:uncharacterized protein YneF (UPF0154 family)